MIRQRKGKQEENNLTEEELTRKTSVPIKDAFSPMKKMSRDKFYRTDK